MSSSPGFWQKIWNHSPKLLGVAGIFIIVFTVRSCLHKRQVVSDSVTVEATVQDAIVETHDTNDTPEYEPHVKYRYTYEGKTYTSTSLNPGTDKNRYTDRARAEDVADYSKGDTVTAYVLPSNPGTAYLTEHPGRGSGGFTIAVIVGGLFALFGLLDFVGDD